MRYPEIDRDLNRSSFGWTAVLDGVLWSWENLSGMDDGEVFLLTLRMVAVSPGSMLGFR